MIKCPECDTKLSVLRTPPTDDVSIVVRLRRCPECKRVYQTAERIVEAKTGKPPEIVFTIDTGVVSDPILQRICRDFSDGTNDALQVDATLAVKQASDHRTFIPHFHTETFKVIDGGQWAKEPDWEPSELLVRSLANIKRHYQLYHKLIRSENT